jgi:hypothetical protein
MDTGRDEIYTTAIAIMNDSKTLSRQELENKYYAFKDKFFKVYTMCSEATAQTRPTIEMHLKLLLGIREDVLDGKKTDIEANVQVSEFMAKKYLYKKDGIFKEPSMEQKKAALNKIIQGERVKKEKAEREAREEASIEEIAEKSGEETAEKSGEETK